MCNENEHNFVHNKIVEKEWKTIMMSNGTQAYCDEKESIEIYCKKCGKRIKRT